MKFRAVIEILSKRGLFTMPDLIFRCRRETRRGAEEFARRVILSGLRRRTPEKTEYFPAHRIWRVTVVEL